jgi:enediyne biosynthesis protein E4
VERINSGLRYLEPPALFRNVRGRFEKIDLPGMPAVAGRGAAFGDLNNDGAMDVVISVLGGHPLVLLNRGGRNHWLTVKLVGTRGNRDGIGAKVRVGEQWGYATTSGSYQSAGDPRVHFGLGAARHATVEILWPGGRKQILENVAADRILTVKEEP